MATRENTKQPASSSSRDVSGSRDSFKSDKNAVSGSQSTSSNSNFNSGTDAKKGTQNLNTSRKSGSSMMDDEMEE
ncbi:hypothetical protein B9G69_002965 [Bdellovibrio sp. SKB1291214]|uniref:hypothetical protein n=1 Tax=Bdellovibrio sp. SKB1291214 TaxID=1732569 RepID=UPI000B51AB8E|nr:hypothetical protein [Bdellovibrio sp. SKB1291214]UYL09532.1 hypothetical protein B9G69_002965 [Bdellovibrio sp. SKB1291214]